jgi:hypothetical protein
LRKKTFEERLWMLEKGLLLSWLLELRKLMSLLKRETALLRGLESQKTDYFLMARPWTLEKQ